MVRLIIPLLTVLAIACGTERESVAIPPIATQIIEAVESGDPDALHALMQSQSRECTLDGDTSPICPSGVLPGTSIEAFPGAECQGYWTTDLRTFAAAALRNAGEAYGIARLGPPPDWAVEHDYPYGTLVVVFAPRAGAMPISAVAVYATDEAVVRAQVFCRRADQLLEPGVDEAPFEVLWLSDQAF